jgi:hypothetical protein
VRPKGSITTRRVSAPDEAVMRRALSALRDGISVKDLARRFQSSGVSERTLYDLARKHGIDLGERRRANSLDLRGEQLSVKGCPSCDRTRAATPEEFPPRDGDEGIGRLCATCEAGRVLNVEARQ